jgi:hypothetical protein
MLITLADRQDTLPALEQYERMIFHSNALTSLLKNYPAASKKLMHLVRLYWALSSKVLTLAKNFAGMLTGNPADSKEVAQVGAQLLDTVREMRLASVEGRWLEGKSPNAPPKDPASKPPLPAEISKM